MLTKNGVSPSVTTTDLWISVVGFGLIYTAIALLDAVLMVRYGRRELAPAPSEGTAEAGQQVRVPSVLY